MPKAGGSRSSGTFDNKMKALFVLLALLGATSLGIAAQIVTVDNVGVSIEIPDDWMRSEKDTFGTVIAPKGEENKKIRIHLTAHKGVPPAEAVQRSAEKIDEIRSERGHRPEQVISSTPITSETGISGQKAIVGQQGIDGPPYLNRYYFERSDGRIFCVCVYHYGDSKFSSDAEQMIIATLSLKK